MLSVPLGGQVQGRGAVGVGGIAQVRGGAARELY